MDIKGDWKKRAVCGLMVLAMALSLLPTSILAADTRSVTDNAIKNGSFEEPAFHDKNSPQWPANNVPDWDTTASDRKIEFGSRRNGKDAPQLMGDQTIPDGSQFAELNADEESTLYQYATTVGGSLNVFNHHTNVDVNSRIVCYDIKELGKQLKKIGMLVVQDQVWNRVTINRAAHKTTRYYLDEFHLLLKEEQTASYSVEIWKRYRKWGGIPTGITQNVKDLLSSREVENIFENSDFIYMLNQAAGDRQILAKQLNISPHQLSYVTHSGEGEGLLFYGNTILPFIDHFPKDTELYRVMTTKPQEVASA